MDPLSQRLLEDVLVGQVLLLAAQIEQEKKNSGVTRLGGDYTQEAIELIKKRKRLIIAQLLVE
jgi:hypothetical protein